ncbi:MAG: hypothetical protein AAGJ08_14185 [Cyanobacteria bacterium P01_H01_bin.35]
MVNLLSKIESDRLKSVNLSENFNFGLKILLKIGKFLSLFDLLL